MLVDEILVRGEPGLVDWQTKLTDSFPVMLANSKRSGTAKVAPQLADKGHCASKNTYFHGVKVHFLAARRPDRMPLPEAIGLSAGSANDLTIMRPIFAQLRNCRIFGDKAFLFDDQLFHFGGHDLISVEPHSIFIICSF